MPYIMQCPCCPHKFKVPDSAVRTTCPKCFNTFEAVDPAAVVLSRGKPARAEDDDAREQEIEETGLAAWLSPWGVVSWSCSALALIAASLLTFRWLPVALAAGGIAIVFAAIPLTTGRRNSKDNLWLGVGGAMGVAVLLVTLFMPDLLNSYWALSKPVAPADLDKLARIPREQRTQKGVPLAPEEFVDAAGEAIRQDNLLIQVESARFGALPGKGNHTYLLIHLQLVNLGHNGTINFQSFAGETNAPVLKDDSGNTYAFIEARPRKQAKGPPDFEPTRSVEREIRPLASLDHLLVFTAPSSNIESLKLEVLASAWGRRGTCKFRIHPPF